MRDQNKLSKERGAIFSPYYINTRRLSHLTNSVLSVSAQTLISTNNVERTRAMHEAELIARSLVTSGRIPSLNTLAHGCGFAGNVIGATWAYANFRGSSAAFRAAENGKRWKKPTMSASVSVAGQTCIFTGELELEHYFSSSSSSYLSGSKQVYVIGRFENDGTNKYGVVQPWLIGDLLDPVTLPLPLSVSETSRIYPEQIDAFRNMRNVRAPDSKRLDEIMLDLPEAYIKTAFAHIIGEPYIQKDWGGERSDLYTSRISIDGVPMSAAFLLKGPSVPRRMFPKDLGKRGDQINRLFEEPAELLVLQHCNSIDSSVVRQMRTFAVEQPANPRRFSIIDGADTYRILRSYGFINTRGRPTH